MSTTTSDAATQFESQEFRSSTLIFHVNLFIYSSIALLAVLRIPHLVGLLKTKGEWYHGFFLGYRSPKRRKGDILRNDSVRTVVGNDEEEKKGNHYHHTRNRQRVHVDENGEPMKMKYPLHIPAVPQLFRPILLLLRVRIRPNYSAGQILILSNYFYALVYATLYKSNPFVDATRPAWVAISQLPLLFAMAQKSNVIGGLLGYGYEKLNFIHRFIGRVIVLGANLHSFFYFYSWSASGTFQRSIARRDNAWGMVGLVSLNLIYFFSTNFWRTKAYNVFRLSHSFGMVLFLVAIHFHHQSMRPYILATAGIYGFDRVVRLLRTRVLTATIQTLPQLDMTHVEVPSLNYGWRAGQHIRLRVLSRRMGWLGWTESHPFTIASVSSSGKPEADGDGLILLCKPAGDWTKRFAGFAKERGYFLDRENGAGGVGGVKVCVEGPYGGPGRMVFSSFSSVLLVVGGSGITFGLAMLQDLVAKDLKGESRVKSVELIWVVQDASSLTPLVPTLIALIQQSIYTPVKISVYYTRPLTGKLPFQASGGLHRSTSVHRSNSASNPNSTNSGIDSNTIQIHKSFTLSPGRPRLAKSLDNAILRAVTLGSGVKDGEGITGVAVGVCGPAGLGEDVEKIVAGIDSARRDQVGGIEIHEETFGW